MSKRKKIGKKIKDFQYVLIDEYYAGVIDTKSKSKRPYLVIQKKHKKKTFIAVPLTSTKDKITGKKKRKEKTWIKVSLKKNKSSYIMLDNFQYFYKKGINNYIFPQATFLTGHKKIKAKKRLKKIKELRKMEIMLDQEISKRMKAKEQH